MALSRTLLGWAVVTVLFVLWREGERRLVRAPGPAASFLGSLLALGLEALLLTLFAGLWFGSLGSGGGVLLFLVVAALMEIPARLRSGGPWPWGTMLSGMVRIVVAGVVLGRLLS